MVRRFLGRLLSVLVSESSSLHPAVATLASRLMSAMLAGPEVTDGVVAALVAHLLDVLGRGDPTELELVIPSWDGYAGAARLEQPATGGAPGVYAVASYGGSLRAAYDAAVAAGGGTVLLPAATVDVTGATGFQWTTGKVLLQGVGRASVLKGAAGMAQVLEVAVGGGGGGTFSDFTVTANGATHAIVQTTTPETSVGTTFERVVAQGAASFQWANSGCEDCAYVACETPGDEGATTTVKPSFTLTVPAGGCTFVGCRFFGEVAFNAQQLTVSGGVGGPFVFTTGGADRTLVLDGVYVYDGGTGGHQAITTTGNLGNVVATGCTFITQAQVVVVNGNIATGVSIALRDCRFVQVRRNTPYGILNASGSGTFLLTGGSVAKTTANCTAFIKVSAPTTVFTHPVVTFGVTTPATG